MCDSEGNRFVLKKRFDGFSHWISQDKDVLMILCLTEMIRKNKDYGTRKLEVIKTART